MTSPSQPASLTPASLARALGQRHLPTKQQAAVIGSPLQPCLVVAGAGAGKTETMAARVVYLVAAGLIQPDQVLGLTFTNKAAQQLSRRIRTRLEQLADSELVRSGGVPEEVRRSLEVVDPTIATYDSFAGTIIREFGLLLPVEPSAKVISETQRYQLASELVRGYNGQLRTSNRLDSVTETLLALSDEMDTHLVSPEEIIEETNALLVEAGEAESQGKPLSQAARQRLDAQRFRLDLLPLVERYRAALRERNWVTFGQRMSMAARLAQSQPMVAEELNRRFRLVMLDEYQDTSHAQRILLRSLFAGNNVTAVGDPMQNIYSWRGATAANLERFRTDFLHRGNKAQKYELTTSFRNPGGVLELANKVSGMILGPADAPRRVVQPLQPLPNAGHGEIAFGYFANADHERSFVAQALQRHYEAAQAAGESFTAAVLVRKRSQLRPMAQALAACGVPYEIVGLGGLLEQPEVADVVAVATMLDQPEDNAAALRILAGPMVQLGANDVLALHQRAKNLSGRASEPAPEAASDPAQRLQQIIDGLEPEHPEALAGLTDALADLGEPDRYSAEGYQRMQELAAKLRYLRNRAATASLVDLVSEIERQCNIRTEALSRGNPHGDGQAGTVHLDAFADVVAEYSRSPEASLRGLLTYLRLALEHDDGLAPGEVQVRADRVQILTVHKAKGLEWQHVSVLHVDESSYETKLESWLTNAKKLPTSLMGDARGPEDHVGVPVLEDLDTSSAAAFAKSLENHRKELKDNVSEEAVRLFYVALTRAERTLMVTASDDPARKKQLSPYEPFALLAEAFSEYRQTWVGDRGDDPARGAPATAAFPQRSLQLGGEAVLRAFTDPADLIEDGDRYEQWEQEVQALIEEHEALMRPVVEVELPRELTASDVVALKQNPEQFARRVRRPVPFKPNRYAKRGTAFHAWIEQRYGAQTLLDEDELPGIGEELHEEDLSVLKEAFLSSEWAQAQPCAVEQPFELALGQHLLRGRMDAVFARGDGNFVVIDWKTGQPPTAAEMRNVEMQLAVYRLAWARLCGIDPECVDAAFYYVRQRRLVRRDHLPSAAAVQALLDDEAKAGSASSAWLEGSGPEH